MHSYPYPSDRVRRHRTQRAVVDSDADRETTDENGAMDGAGLGATTQKN